MWKICGQNVDKYFEKNCKKVVHILSITYPHKIGSYPHSYPQFKQGLFFS